MPDSSFLCTRVVCCLVLDVWCFRSRLPHRRGKSECKQKKCSYFECPSEDPCPLVVISKESGILLRRVIAKSKTESPHTRDGTPWAQSGIPYSYVQDEEKCGVRSTQSRHPADQIAPQYTVPGWPKSDDLINNLMNEVYTSIIQSRAAT